MMPGRPWRLDARATVDAAALGSLCAWTTLALASHRHEQLPLSIFLPVMIAAWAAVLTAFRAAGRLPPASLVPRLWLWAVAFRLIGCAARPVLEDDYFRYLWDGWVFAHTGNPYGTTPADHFHDPAVPDALVPVLNGINHPEVPTVYGPVAQWAFLLSHAVAPGVLWPWKLLLVGCELLTLGLLLRVAPPSRALLFAWCPLLVQETAFNAHPEALGILPMVAAAIGAHAGRTAGAASGFAIAAGVKPLGALVAPLALGWRQPRGWAVFAATLLVVWAPFAAGGTLSEWTGLVVFARHWEFNSSAFAVLAALAGDDLARPIAAMLFAAGYAVLLAAGPRIAGAETGPRSLALGGWAYGGLLLLSPVVNPWYVAWLVPCVVFRPTRAGIAAMAAVSLSYVHGLNVGDVSIGLYGHPVWVRPLEYGIVAAAALSGVLARASARAQLVAGKEIGVQQLVGRR